MVKLFIKVSLGILFGLLIYLGFSFVASEKVEASHGCVNSGVYSCLSVHVRDGSSSGPWLSGADVLVAIPVLRSGYYCYAPGKSGTLAADTTDSSGRAQIDNICCTSVLTGNVRIMIQKAGYVPWPANAVVSDPTTWNSYSFSNGASRTIDIYLARIPRLNVNSSGASSVSIGGSPSSLGGTTNYSETDSPTLSGTLTAPLTASGNNFTGWSGCDSVSGIFNVNCNVTVNPNETQTVTANYSASVTNTLNVRSSGVSSVPITGSPSGLGGTTNYTETSSSTISGTLTAPNTSGAGTFSSWSGCDSVSGRDCTVSVSGGATQTVTANYTVPAGTNTLNVNSSPITGIAISGTYSGITNYSTNSSSTLSGTLTAPATFGSYNFSSWSGCDSSSGNNCTVNVSGGASQTVTANYTSGGIVEPDLVIRNNSGGGSPVLTVSGGTLSGTNLTVAAGTAVTFNFRTVNIGSGTTGASSCTVVEAFGSTFTPTPTSCESPPPSGKQWFPVGTLSASSFASHSLTTQWNTAGVYSMLFRADARGTIVENDEGNNDVILNVTVNALQPNLRVLPGSFTFTPASISVGTLMNIQARIENNGATNVSSLFYNRLRVDNGSGYVTVSPDQTIPSLSTGASTQVTWSYTPTVSGNHTFEVCADTSDIGTNNNRVAESNETVGDNCLTATVTVSSSQPWLKTVGGNVGSKNGIIASYPTDLCPGDLFYCNSTYMISAVGSITTHTFKSAKGWLLNGYNPGLGKYNNYDAFKTGFAAGACTRTGHSLPDNKGKFYYPSTVSWSGSWVSAPCPTPTSSSKEASVVFINGNLVINQDFILTGHRPMIFVISGSLIIDNSVDRVDGMFIANNNFDSGASNNRLTINGSVAAVLGSTGSMNFRRSYNSSSDPAELINFEPKYLYLLADFIGVSASIYRESNP